VTREDPLAGALDSARRTIARVPDVEEGGPGGPRDRPASAGRRLPARTQRERVLDALRRAGDHGITAVDFLLPDVVDGGPPIVRLPARVDELRHAGYVIVGAGRRAKCQVYVLNEPARAATRDDDDQAALFTAAVGAAPPRSPYAAEAA
jgi:hypothetical protein